MTTEAENQEIAYWRDQADHWRRKARENKNQMHSWQSLYRDLLREISRKLDHLKDTP